jgi:hypothetical protein
MEIPEFKNDCYTTLEEAGIEYAQQVGKKALNFESAICRSVFKLGILEYFKGKIPVKESKNYIAHLCDLDPEKNGCADGVGRLAYYYGFTAKESSELCKVGEVGVPEIETYFEGCMGGYGNWSRFGDFWNSYESINDVFSKYCNGVDDRGIPSCLGYGLRSYVRFGLTDGSSERRLIEFYNLCKLRGDIKSFCGVYVGFTLADVYNDYPSGKGILKGKALANKVDQYCDFDSRADCYASFVAWYINQWTFSFVGELAIEDTNNVCQNLRLMSDRELCNTRVRAEIDRYKGRINNAKKES